MNFMSHSNNFPKNTCPHMLKWHKIMCVSHKFWLDFKSHSTGWNLAPGHESMVEGVTGLRKEPKESTFILLNWHRSNCLLNTYLCVPRLMKVPGDHQKELLLVVNEYYYRDPQLVQLEIVIVECSALNVMCILSHFTQYSGIIKGRTERL